MERKLIFYIIIVFSIIIIPLNNEKWQSLPMLAVMYAAPFLLLIKYHQFRNDDILLIIIIATLFLSSITNPQNFRFSTVIYSSMFLMTFMLYRRLLDYNTFNSLDFEKITSIIVKLYALVLVLQQICVIAHIPILNMSYNIVPGSFKLNSLSNEASHTGRIIMILAYASIKMKELNYGIEHISLSELYKMDKWLVISMIFVSFFSMSLACILCLLILSLYFIPRQKYILAFSIIAVVFTAFILSPLEQAERLRLLLPAIETLDPQLLYSIDSSSAARIAPFLVYIKEFDLTNFNTWFGFGCDYGGLHTFSFISGVDVEENIGVGGIVNFIYDYGLVSFIPFLIFVIKITGVKSMEFLFFMTVYFICAFNIHITWLFIMIVYTILYFKKSYYNEIDINNCSNL